MSKDWFVRRSGKVAGPFSSSKLKDLIANGQVNESDEVSQSSEGPWQVASKLKGISFPRQFTTFPPPAPSYPAPSSIEAPSFNRKEEQIWKGTPSQWTNFSSFVLCGLFSWLIIPIFVAVWRFLQVMTTNYELTNQRLKVSHGVLSRSVEDIELYRIKDSSISQSFVQRLLGLSDIQVITSDATNKNARLRSIRNGNELKEKIRDLSENERRIKRVREVDMASY